MHPPIITVSGPGLTLSQGPVDTTTCPIIPQSGMPKTDMHGKLAVDLGGGKRAVGQPVWKWQGKAHG